MAESGRRERTAPRRTAHAKHTRMRRGRRGRVRAVQDVATSKGGGRTSAMCCLVRGCRQRNCRHHARGSHRVDVSWGAMQLAGEAGGSLWRQRRLPRRELSALPAAASRRASTTCARGRRACAVKSAFFFRRLHGYHSPSPWHGVTGCPEFALASSLSFNQESRLDLHLWPSETLVTTLRYCIPREQRWKHSLSNSFR